VRQYSAQRRGSHPPLGRARATRAAGLGNVTGGGVDHLAVDGDISQHESQDGFSFKFPGLLVLNQLRQASAPRGITVWPFITTASSMLARKVWPRCAT